MEGAGGSAGTEPQSQTNEACSVPLVPPQDCEKITPDGGVLKHVVEAGAGELPVLHGRCLGK
jgi:hypothetical protein